MGEWELVFYETASGNSPVIEFLDELSADDTSGVTDVLELLQIYGVRLGMPHARRLQGTDLWEIRTRGRVHHRILYVSVTRQRMLLLHGFTKKTEKTPAREIRTAEVRLKDYRERHRQ
jgi:phage-related protein